MPRKQQLRGHAAVRPTVDELLGSVERLNRASADFLKIDLKTALTFTKIARQTQDGTRRERNRMEARHAYDTVLKLVPKIDLSKDEARTITKGLTQLRSELRELGEVV